MTTVAPEFVSFLLSELGELGEISARRFFGGWQLRIGGTQIAIVMKGALYFRADEDLRRALERDGSKPFSYMKSGKQVFVTKYMSAPENAVDDMDLLRTWASRVIEHA
jgi:DNA transformation protein